jgi:hypothetical protein
MANYDEQIIARRRAGVQPQDSLWFPAIGNGPDLNGVIKKRAAVSGGF